ncbi:MAG: S9 family peptidase [Anaerolineaceae bacterium]|nr:S9 family peptidase [Anaerolineaceae bacterium]
MSSDIRVPTIDEMIELPELDTVQISPDGRRAAYIEKVPDWEKNEYVTQVWMLDMDTHQTCQMTFAAASSHSPRWSPDGKRLAFLSKREEDKFTQLYWLSVLGGEAQRLSEFKTDVESIYWSPDGQKIAFLAVPPESESQKTRKKKFGEFHIEDQDFQCNQLWLFDIGSRKTTRLIRDSIHIVDIDWSPVGKNIAFEAWASPDEKEFDKGIIYSLNVESLKVQIMTDQGCQTPRWSPDGAYIGFARFRKPNMVANNELCYLPKSGGDVYVIPSTFDEYLTLEKWGLQGMYFSVILRTEIHLCCMQVDSGEVEQITPSDQEGWFAMSYSFNQDFTRVACIASDRQRWTEIMVINVQNKEIAVCTNFQDKISNWDLAVREVFNWKSLDGTPIEGVLTRPRDFDPNRKYPLLVVIHGGPTWISPQALLAGYECRYYPIQQWVARGALVLEPNYRGSAGYGETFRKLNIGNLGIGDYEDVISGVDALIERGWVDDERLGSMGWSQGGYISAFITTYSNRFKAVSVGAGISSWATYYVNTDIHPFVMDYLGATPWDDREVYDKTAPIHYIKQACTPTLIQHGELDKRVPIPNAYELYQGLQDMDVETKLVVYEGMPHGIRKPRLTRHVMQDNFDWFNHWIFGDKLEKQEKRICYVSLPGMDYVDQEKVQNGLQPKVPCLRDVYRWSVRDSADFLILTKEGLISVNPGNEPVKENIVIAEVLPLITRLTEQLSELKFDKLVLYTQEVTENPGATIFLGCLQIAVGLVGDMQIEHKEYSRQD